MKTVLVTGSTDGIGLQTAVELAKKRLRVLMHGKNEEHGKQAVDFVRKSSGNKDIFYFNADLSDFTEVKKLAAEVKNNFPALDILINNAGVFEMNRIILPNGFEKTFMVNYLASFTLTLSLLETLKASDEARIVNVSSMAQAGTIDFDNLNGEKYYDGYNAYAVSKLENVLLTYKLARLLKGSHITSNCLHPGVISTKLLHAGWGIGGASTSEGARTSIYAATSPELKGKSGLYLVNSHESKSSAISYDRKVQDRLWEISLQLTGLSNPF